MKNYDDLPEYIKELLTKEACVEISDLTTARSFLELAKKYKVSINVIKEIKLDIATTNELREKIRLASINLPKKINNYPNLTEEQLNYILQKQDEISKYLKSL